MRLCVLFMALMLRHTLAFPTSETEDNPETDGEISKRIIGSSVVTSVSVILNGDEPQYMDAVGKPIPKPVAPLQVASPINLLNPDRYEFYTFDDSGELVKRLMTLQEIQSIVANGDGDGGAAVIHNIPISDNNPDKNVQDIVASVQSVLNKEVEWKRNSSNHQPVLDTPDVSSSWSMILPAIFGNTGGDIFPPKHQQVVMTPDTVVMEATAKTTTSKPKPSSSRPKPDKSKLPPRRRPSTTTRPEHDNDDNMQPSSIVDKQEIVKPIFNRNETSTTAPSSSTTLTSNTPMVKNPTTVTKPTKGQTKPTTMATKTTAVTKPMKMEKIPTTTTKIQSELEALSSILSSSEDSTEIDTTTKRMSIKPTKMTTTTTEMPKTTKTVTTSKISETPSTLKSEIKENNTELGEHPENPNSTEAEQEYDYEATTIHIKDFMDSMSENDHDMNAKLSFDQILESLKEVSQTDKINQEKDQSLLYTTIRPVMDNAGIYLNDKMNEKLDSEEIMATTVLPTKEEIIGTKMGENELMSKVHSDNLKEMPEDADTKVTDDSNVMKFEPLFVDLKDPILIDLTTESPVTDIPTTIQDDLVDEEHTELRPMKENGPKFETDIELVKEPITKNDIKPESNIKIMDEVTKMKKPSPISDMKEPSPWVETVEKFIEENLSSTDKVLVANEKNEELFVKKPQQSVSINMSDFKDQAATVASIIEGSSFGLSESGEDLHRSEEIDALLSDVINQMTDNPSTMVPSQLRNEVSSANITKDRLEDVNNNTDTSNKFGKLESLALVSDAMKNEISPKIDVIGNSDVSYEHSVVKETSSVSVESIDSIEKMDEDMDISAITTEKMYEENYENSDESMKLDENNEHPTESAIMSESHTENSEKLIPMTSFIDKSTETSMETSNNEEHTYSSDEISETTENLQDPLSENTSDANDSQTEQEFEDSSEGTTVLPNEDDHESSGDMSEEDNETTEKDDLATITVDVNDKEMSEKLNKGSEEEHEEEDIEKTTVAIQAHTEDKIAVPSKPTQFPAHNNIQRKDDQEIAITTKSTPILNLFNINETEHAYIKLGESTWSPDKSLALPSTAKSSTGKSAEIIDDVTTPAAPIPTTHDMKDITRRTNRPGAYHPFLPFNNQRPMARPPALSNLKVAQLSQIQARLPVKLDPTPDQALGLEASTADLQDDVHEFANLCNELAFSYWKSITAEKISPARSLVISPFALTSMLSMVFLGARGGTSGEMNEILRLDDMVTFNPHLVFKNITDSFEHAQDSDIAASAFVREIFTDRANGKVLQFFKEKTQQLYSGHVEEVNFNVVNDIIRRRTNLLVKRHTMGKVQEYLRTNSVWVNGPLATLSANLFQTDCSRATMNERDGEMFFQVHPSIRQRRLIPVPAVVYRAGFTAGYDSDLDATLVAFGSMYDTVSTIYIIPGQQGLIAPGDSLDRLESTLMENGISKNIWSRLLTSLMERPGLEVQLPRFSHRSFINASMGLQRMGLRALFNSDDADLRGLTGSSNKDVYLSDMVQINTFSTCGEEKIGDSHHVEMYPAPPLRRRNDVGDEQLLDGLSNSQQDNNSQDNGRAFYDDLLDPKYLELPLPLRPRQARIPEAPRLRLDKPFLYFVRHNPTGMILFMGRFNPRLLP